MNAQDLEDVNFKMDCNKGICISIIKDLLSNNQPLCLLLMKVKELSIMKSSQENDSLLKLLNNGSSYEQIFMANDITSEEITNAAILLSYQKMMSMDTECESPLSEEKLSDLQNEVANITDKKINLFDMTIMFEITRYFDIYPNLRSVFNSSASAYTKLFNCIKKIYRNDLFTNDTSVSNVIKFIFDFINYKINELEDIDIDDMLSQVLRIKNIIE